MLIMRIDWETKREITACTSSKFQTITIGIKQ